MALLDASNLHPDGEEGGGRRESLIKMKLVPVRDGDEIPLKGISYGSKTRCENDSAFDTLTSTLSTL